MDAFNVEGKMSNLLILVNLSFLIIYDKPSLNILVYSSTVKSTNVSWAERISITYSDLAARTPNTSPIYSKLEMRTSGSIPSSRKLLITAVNLEQPRNVKRNGLLQNLFIHRMSLTK